MLQDQNSHDDSRTKAEMPDVAPQSSAGGTYVGRVGILGMSAYLMLLGTFLFYALVAIWPVPVSIAVTSVRPSQGPTTGGTIVTISGTGFTDGVQVSFDNIPSTEVTRVSEINIRAMVPPRKEEGLVAVQVIGPNGQKSTLANAFRFMTTSTAGTATGAAAAPETPESPTSSGVAANDVSDAKKRNGGDLAGSSKNNVSNGNSSGGSREEAGGCAKPFFFEWACSLRDNIRLLLVVIIVGALGGLIHVMRSFYWYVGNRDLRSSWLLMYVLLPFVGAGLALLFYLIIRGGFAPQSVPTQSTIDSYAALAALVGMFSQQALAKLKQIAESVFTTADKGKDQATSAASPTLAALKPTSGPTAGGTVVTLTGTGFSDRIDAKFGGTPTKTLKMVSDTQLEVATPAHAVGRVDVEVSDNRGQKSSLPGAFTYLDLPQTPTQPVSNPTQVG